MKQLLLLLSCLVLMVGLVSAASEEDGSPDQNRLRHNPQVKTYRENSENVPQYVEGVLAEKVARGNEAAAAVDFFERHKAAYRMTDPAAELTVRRTDIDRLGMRHVRLSQQYRGLPVIGGELIAHFDADNVLKVVNGTYHPDIGVETTPRLTSADALNAARSDLESFFGAGKPGEPVLVIFPWEGVDYLAWRLFLYSDTPMGRWEYLVDAATGNVIFKANRIMNTEAIGTGINVMGDPREHIDTDDNGTVFRMIDYTRRANNNIHGHDGQMPTGNYIQTNIAGYSLPGSVATDADNYWDDPASQ